MNTLGCKICGHIEFEEAPNRCPVCEATKENFTPDPEAIKKPADLTKLSEGEKKHIPTLVVVKTCGLIPGGECLDVHVKVGEIEHIMQKGHYIRYLDFYLNKKYIARTALTPENLHPAAALHLKVKKGSLIALENCNLHGNWMAEVNLAGGA